MTDRERTQRKLKAELERLKQTFDLRRGLKIRWLPGQVRHIRGRKIAGEVVGKEICIYAESRPEALLVLRHELLEWVLLEKFTMPYKRVINTLLAVLEEQIYCEKEQLVKKLVHLIWGEGEKETE